MLSLTDSTGLGLPSGVGLAQTVELRGQSLLGTNFIWAIWSLLGLLKFLSITPHPSERCIFYIGVVGGELSGRHMVLGYENLYYSILSLSYLLLSWEQGNITISLGNSLLLLSNCWCLNSLFMFPGIRDILIPSPNLDFLPIFLDFKFKTNIITVLIWIWFSFTNSGNRKQCRSSYDPLKSNQCPSTSTWTSFHNYFNSSSTSDACLVKILRRRTVHGDSPILAFLPL